ncbi:hypothetical protein [uncultured Alcanivorax sp.]|uniref:hypothetical protein n=1 Tax=uncultured Alcanivorax sp. TaxID=191215 RepID=UPI0032B15CF2
MPAVQAFQVVEIGIVEPGAQSSTRFTAGDSSGQAAKHGTGDAANSRSRRPKRHADGCTDASSASRHGNATGGTSNSADRTANLAAILQGDDPDRAAGRTLNDHEASMKWDQEGHSFLASWG